MCRRLLPLLLVSLTACAPKVSGEAATQTMRAGDLEITVSAPEWVTRQEFYPLKVTYTNKGKRTLNLSDPLDCAYIWGAEQIESGKAPKPRTTYACPTIPAALKTLAPNESHAGEYHVIISGYPAGEYRLTPEQLRQLSPAEYRAKAARLPLTPPPQEIRFQIR